MPRKLQKPAMPDDIAGFLASINRLSKETDAYGRKWMDAKRGCYLFYDLDGEPLYVGSTKESMRTRVRRHLTNQRTDTVAMRILDVMEVSEIEIFPLWDEEPTGTGQVAEGDIANLEATVYWQASDESKLGLVLNERMLPRPLVPEKVPSSLRYSLLTDEALRLRRQPDVRLARRARTLTALLDVIRERGKVSPGIRRAAVIQAARLLYGAMSQSAGHAGKLPPKMWELINKDLIFAEMSAGLRATSGS